MHRTISNLLRMLCLGIGMTASAQDNPVYIDESHVAVQMLEQADALATTNPEEAVRLLQELIDSSGRQLVPTVESPNPMLFESVREAANRRFREDPRLLKLMQDRYTGTARRILQEGRLQEVVELHALTTPGLDAQVTLGRRDIELGALERGVFRLQEALQHPDMDARTRADALYGIGVAARLLEDDALRDMVDAELSRLAQDGEAHRQALESMTTSRTARRNHTVMETGEAASIDQLVVQSIWSMPLKDSLLNQRMDHPGIVGTTGRNNLVGDSGQGWFSTVIPSMRDDLVFINLGEQVLALDTLTGHPRWTSRRQKNTLRLDPSERPSGVNTIELEGRYLVTAMGHQYPTQRSGDGLLLCLDAETGLVRWGIQVDDNPDIEQSEGLFICSPPVIDEGTVYVLARKISPQQLLGEVLVAVDLIEGEIKWSTWISSAGRLRRNLIQNSTAPLVADGHVYVNTVTGAIASVDSTNGDLKWLQRLPTADNTTPPSGAARPYTHVQPIMVDGRLVCISPDGTEVLSLDPDNGTVLKSISATNPDRWNHPVYLLTTGEHVISVGRDVRCFDGNRLESPRWVLDLSTDTGSPVPEGRVQLLEDSVIIPANGRVLQVDLDTGRIRDTLEIEHEGNPLFAGQQLLIASATHLDAYTALDRARTVLEARITEHPERMRPRLDLVRLAARSDQSELLRNSARDTLDMLPGKTDAAAGPARDQLMNHLVDALQSEADPNTEHGRDLRALLIETADTPDRELEALLVLGEWTRQSDPDDSAELWRSILERENISRAWYEENGLHASGGDWARRRLSNLEVESMPTDSMGWIDPVDPDDIDHLIGSARDNLRTEQSPVRMATVLPEILDRLIEVDKIDTSLGLLQAWETRFPTVPLLDDGEARMAMDWSRSLRSGNELLAGKPDANMAVAEPERISGSLLSIAQGSMIDPPTTAPLLTRQSSIRSIDARSMTPVWSARSPGLNNALLQQDDERIAILVDHGDLKPELLQIDAATGEPLNDPLDLASVFEGMDVAPTGQPAILPDGRTIESKELLISSNPESVTLVRRDGQIVNLGGEDGSTVRWSHRLPVRVVHGIHPWPDGVVVVGPDPDSEQPLAVSNADPLLYHLDYETGSPRRLQWPSEIGRFLWMTRSPLNDLILGGDEGIACIGWPDHTPRWISTQPTARATRQGWASTEAVLLMDEQERLHLADMETGETMGELSTPEYRDQGMLRDVKADGRGFRILRESSLAIHDPSGTMIATDGIPHEYKFEHLLSDGGVHVLLAHRQTVSGMGGGGRRHLYRISILDESGRILDLLDLFPLGSRIRAVRLHGRLLMIETKDTVDFVTLPPIGEG